MTNPKDDDNRGVNDDDANYEYAPISFTDKDLPVITVPLAVGTLQWGTTPVDEYVINKSGGVLDETTARDVVQTFTTEGDVTLWDTAEGYGGGTSEKRLGRLLFRNQNLNQNNNVNNNKSSSSSNIVVMTKFLPVPWRGLFSHGCMERAVRASCRRLQILTIPIYLLHSPIHWLRDIEYWVECAAMCKHKGLIQTLGLSNCNANQVRRAVEAGKKFGIDVVLNQVHYSLLDYNSVALQEMEATCRQLDVVIVAFSPLGQGLLTDKLTQQTCETHNRVAKMLKLEWNDIQDLRTCLREVALKYDKTMAQVAINWCICHSTIPLVGCRSVAQAKDTLGALGWKLKDNDVQKLDAVALSKSTLDSPAWRRMIFVTLFGIVMIVCRILDYLGYGMVKAAKI